MRLVAIVIACGCAHAPPPTTSPAPARPGRDGVAVVAEHGPDLGECDALLRHAIDLVAPAEATQADLADVAASARDAWRVKCLTMPRPIYACAISAATKTDLVACDQPMRSSSTSNSKVAPGGMTAPAPRSP